MRNIKYLVMDVDGTLTDGKIYMGQEGEAVKAFNIKDGCGIKEILPKIEIVPVIITARKSHILENRCREIGITEVHQGFRQKLKKLIEVVKDDLSSVAYMGDDIPDIPCMEAVKKAGGFVLCPSDAIPEIRALADYVSGYPAGDGAVRDCINYLVQKDEQAVIEERIRKAIEIIFKGSYIDQTGGVFADGSQYTIQEYTTKEETECVLESHRKHIDIQYMIEGHEEFKTYSTMGLTSIGQYDSQKDVDYWQDGIASSHSVMVPGSLIVVYNGQPHKGAIRCGKPEKVRKLVIKMDV